MEKLRRLREAAGANPIELDDLLEAFLVPAFRSAEKSPEWVKLMGRLHAEGVMPAVGRKHFGPVGELFLTELRRALPHLPPDEMAWRINFAAGAMALALRVMPMGGLHGLPSEAPTQVARRIVAFVSGGFRAPVAAPEDVEIKR
jgi:hypothetical protein